MKFRIHSEIDGVEDSEDSIVLEGDTIEEVRTKADIETGKRGWVNCWSEEIEV